MTTLILMVGVPGSGKSTLIEAAFPGAVVVCPDSKIGYTKENPWTPQAAKRAWDEARDELAAAIGRGEETIVFDATLVSVKKRKHYIQLARQHDLRIAAIYCSNTSLAKERNEARELFRRVPRESFERMATSLVGPTKEEGFDFVVEYDGVSLKKTASEIEKIRKG